MDAGEGVIVVKPDEETEKEYLDKKAAYEQERARPKMSDSSRQLPRMARESICVLTLVMYRISEMHFR